MRCTDCGTPHICLGERRHDCEKCGAWWIPVDHATIGSSPTWPYVLAFARLMEAKLEKNRHKGNREGWSRDLPRELMKRLREEVSELNTAIGCWLHVEDEIEHVQRHADTIAKEAADVANFAMMIADVCGGLVAPATAQGKGVGP